MREYHYTESGLDNVFLVGIETCHDEAGEETVCIPNHNGLHRTIAEAIIGTERGLLPKEMRFLRTELAKTQHELAQHFQVDHQTVGRWERGETPIDIRCDLILRLLVKEILNVETKWTIQEITKGLAPSAHTVVIKIDGSDPQHYKQAA
jgi:DNA-binding transcriptional regulator YiaG